jgi:hypothetical protein
MSEIKKMKTESEIRKLLEYLRHFNEKNFQNEGDKKLVFIDEDGNQELEPGTNASEVLGNTLLAIRTLQWVLGESIASPDTIETFLDGIKGYW